MGDGDLSMACMRIIFATLTQPVEGAPRGGVGAVGARPTVHSSVMHLCMEAGLLDALDPLQYGEESDVQTMACGLADMFEVEMEDEGEAVSAVASASCSGGFSGEGAGFAWASPGGGIGMGGIGTGFPSGASITDMYAPLVGGGSAGASEAGVGAGRGRHMAMPAWMGAAPP